MPDDEHAHDARAASRLGLTAREVRQQVLMDHWRQIARMTSSFMATLGRVEAPALYRQRGRTTGRATSVADPRADLKLVMSWLYATEYIAHDQPTVEAARAVTGTVTTVSFVAHHRARETGVPVDPDEASAWAQALTGDDENLLDASLSPASASIPCVPGRPPRPLTMYFYLYRDGAHRAAPMPSPVREYLRL